VEILPVFEQEVEVVVFFLGNDIVGFGELQRKADQFFPFFGCGVIIKVVHRFSEVILPLVGVQIGNYIHLFVEVDINREFFRKVVPDNNVFMSGNAEVNCGKDHQQMVSGYRFVHTVVGHTREIGMSVNYGMPITDRDR